MALTRRVQECEHGGPQMPGDYAGPRKPQRPLGRIQVVLLGHSWCPASWPDPALWVSPQYGSAPAHPRAPCLLSVFPALTLLPASQTLQLPQRAAFPSISPSSPSFHSPVSAVSNPGLLPACSHLPGPPAALSAPCVPMFLSVNWDENVSSLTLRNVSLIFHTSDLGQWGGGLLELTQDQ